LKLIIVADEQSTKVAPRGKGSFDFPTHAITPQPAAIVGRWFFAPSAVPADQQHAALEQTLSQRTAVVATVGHDSQRPSLWAASASQFPRASRDQSASRRNTMAVD